ncbi:MAG: hypothetical protein KDA75_20395, partial [Planctomycetaceae bacterium]|nr:hypothetical protein [Planctomycetaceae bacterium]
SSKDANQSPVAGRVGLVPATGNDEANPRRPTFAVGVHKTPLLETGADRSPQLWTASPDAAHDHRNLPVALTTSLPALTGGRMTAND